VLEFAEVYADGGFDVLVGNPPWDVLTVNRDDFFSRYEPSFRSHPSSEKDEIQNRILEDQDKEEAWQEYKQSMELRAKYFNNSPAYELQSPNIDGRRVASENDLSALFLERIFQLMRNDGQVSLVLPGNIFNGAASKDLRMRMLDGSRIRSLIEFENHGIFDGLHPQYQFGVVTYRSSGETETLNGVFRQMDLNVLNELEERTVEIPRRVLAEYSPKARIFPYVTSQIEADVLDTILQHSSLGEPGDWQAVPLTKELHEPSDKHLFVSPSESDYSIYGGANIHQFHPGASLAGTIEVPTYGGIEGNEPDVSAKRRVQEKKFNAGDLKHAIYTEFDGENTSKSQLGS
jgi:hypothetical protein